jgi:hypothetical protein
MFRDVEWRTENFSDQGVPARDQRMQKLLISGSINTQLGGRFVEVPFHYDRGTVIERVG